MIPYLSVIIPAFNEEAIIADHVTQVAEFCYRHLGPDKPFEIVVVDDGSSDETPEVLAKLMQERDYLRVERHPRNMGRGQGLITGFNAVRGEYVVSLDADLSYTPEHIARLLPPLESGLADVVLASAYHPEGSVANVPFSRALISKLGNKVLASSFKEKIHTVTCIVRGYRREVLEAVTLFSRGKEIHLEILQKARMLGFKIMEVPADLSWRAGKRTSGRKGLTLSSFSNMASHHLFFNFLYRPSALFWIPLILLLLIFFITTYLNIYGYVDVYLQLDEFSGFNRFYQALREHMLFAKLTYFVWAMCVLLLFQFVSQIFLAKQNNHYFAETFSMLSHMNQRLKKIEAREQDADSREDAG
ncbi:MAG: glycosyltransferase family 2 protein [Desulfovibrio sp.]|nr:MAG: glycosyltransferase family 2 protein [Desulfovibrio sp.]